eukprot:9307184-Alexandrium_andersonii.AAC.1
MVDGRGPGVDRPLLRPGLRQHGAGRPRPHDRSNIGTVAPSPGRGDRADACAGLREGGGRDGRWRPQGQVECNRG